MKNTVTVVGSFVVDLMARSEHIPVQGETVKGSFFKMGPGGKGSNQAVAAHRSGGSVVLVTKVGKDLFGKLATVFYTGEKMDTRSIFEDPELTTGIALIMVDENTSQNSITVVPGACGAIKQSEMTQVASVLDGTKVLITQLETNLDILPDAVGRVHKNGGISILNPAPAQKLDREFIALFDIVTPNETEATTLTGIPVVDRASAQKAAQAFQRMGVHDVIITLGSQGAFLLQHDGTSRMFPTMDVKVVDTTGAGDAFNGGFATALAEGLSLQESMMFATAVASLSVTKMGTAPAMPMRKEVDAFLAFMDTKAYWELVK
jgi:ribokinase